MRNENRELKKEALNQLCKDTELLPAFDQVMASSIEELEEIANRKYIVLLMAHGNPDHGESPDEIAPRFKAVCGTVEGCGEMVRQYIDTYDLGGGNFTGGHIYWNGKYQGFIAYNGRYLEKERTLYEEDGKVMDIEKKLNKARELHYGETMPWC